MKLKITALLEEALTQLKVTGILGSSDNHTAQVTRTKDSSHGDFTSNIAMLLAKENKTSPRELAKKIIDAIPDSDFINKTELAGPGFINFYLQQEESFNVIERILNNGDTYGTSETGRGEKVLIEYVSANPTGPLHVGHGRGAAFGATLVSLMKAVGYSVDSEYYVNDAGRQMNILATSIWIRYLQINNIEVDFPVNGYKGDYVNDIAKSIQKKYNDKFVLDSSKIIGGLPPDENDGGDKEIYIDCLIVKSRDLLGDDYQLFFNAGLTAILDDIKDDLQQFGVSFDHWYSEQSLSDKGLIDKAIKQLIKMGHVYDNNGTLWFRSTDFGDEKDRVVVRENGQPTYFASDIAYHMDKFSRGYNSVINIWGADHHGYISRVNAAIQAFNKDASKLKIFLVQFAILYRGKERLQMSTRSGSFVTLRELREEVGNDAARFFYVMRKCEQHMDFDLELAKSQSNDNPVYYIQYAHARICSVFGQLKDKGFKHDISNGTEKISSLQEPQETNIIKSLARFSEIVERAALNAEPHLLAHYLRELANFFHTYYNAHQFIVDNNDIRNARLNLILATQQVIKNGLQLLGVSVPREM